MKISRRWQIVWISAVMVAVLALVHFSWDNSQQPRSVVPSTQAVNYSVIEAEMATKLPVLAKEAEGWPVGISDVDPLYQKLPPAIAALSPRFIFVGDDYIAMELGGQRAPHISEGIALPLSASFKKRIAQGSNIGNVGGPEFTPIVGNLFRYSGYDLRALARP